ncbi:YidH family protein [Paeniglutamicibacter sp. NPDC012692]|uniref:YidH family protein n=1 Tax=Paeniglutamicibacter sp. NPDC012692 TaxID=3364388 RepID=UPI0036BDB089
MAEHDEENDRGALAKRILPGGSEPDPRFTLANERTFLAWIRTSLAFLAGGIALEAFAAHEFPAPLRTGISVFLIIIGMLISGGAALRWRRIELSMRHGKPLPLPLIIPILGLGGAIAAAVVAVLIATKL